MWAIERTENNLKKWVHCDTDTYFKEAVIDCLIQIARNLADISDTLNEVHGYDLSDKPKAKAEPVIPDPEKR